MRMEIICEPTDTVTNQNLLFEIDRSFKRMEAKNEDLLQNLNLDQYLHVQSEASSLAQLVVLPQPTNGRRSTILKTLQTSKNYLQGITLGDYLGGIVYKELK